MVFSSLLFLFRFLPLILIAYFVAPKRLRNGVLFIGSLVFYGWGEPVYISLLLFSTVVDYMHGKMVSKFLSAGNKKAALRAVMSSAVINLGLLGFFKYADFLLGGVNVVFGVSIPLLGIALPIGISFYTFQTMSYTIDIYRSKAKVQDNIVAFGAYVSMFPQLIAGPIVRYSTIADELRERTETLHMFAVGVRWFVIGLSKKVLIANQVGALWMEIQGISGDERSVLMLWIGIFAFGMQIYFDFSGYSDMAVGLGYLFGFHFPENFNYPYMAKSITDFWRRWHISLSTWFKEYVYIPLGGNRKGQKTQIRNILIVWMLTGIWHGAGWNFLLWGTYFGCLLLLEKLLLNVYLEKMPGFLQGTYTMILVFLGWVLFAHDDISAGVLYIRHMFGGGSLVWTGQRTWYLLITNLPLLLVSLLGSTRIPKHIGRLLLNKKGHAIFECSFIAAMFVLVLAYLVNASYNPFLYFRF